MRAAILAISALLLLAAPASANFLSLQSGELTLLVRSRSSVPPISLPATGTPIPIFVSSAGGSFSLPAAVVTGTATVGSSAFPTTPPGISSLGLQADNQSGSFAAGGGPGGGFGGAEGLTGVLRLGFLGGIVNISIPLGVAGAGGQVTAVNAGVKVTVTGHAWTTGTAVVTGVSAFSTTTGNGVISVNTVALAGADNRTAGHRGTVQLVTPIRVLTGVAGDFPVFAIQTLTFVPEPGSLSLLGASALALGVVGYRRRRS